MAIRKEFLGRGWSFPFTFDPATGSVAFSEYEENIRQNVTIILGTRPGERQMVRDFGCSIHDLLFAPATSSTRHRAARYVRNALERWEPRIEVVGVKSRLDPKGTIELDVEYKIVSTGAVVHHSQVVDKV